MSCSHFITKSIYGTCLCRFAWQLCKSRDVKQYIWCRCHLLIVRIERQAWNLTHRKLRPMNDATRVIATRLISWHSFARSFECVSCPLKNFSFKSVQTRARSFAIHHLIVFIHTFEIWNDVGAAYHVNQPLFIRPARPVCRHGCSALCRHYKLTSNAVETRPTPGLDTAAVSAVGRHRSADLRSTEWRGRAYRFKMNEILNELNHSPLGVAAIIIDDHCIHEHRARGIAVGRQTSI